MAIEGRATQEGTARYRDRFRADMAEHHFRFEQNLWLSSIGTGTYLGQWDEETDRHYREAVERAVELGANVIDTAANYRFQRSERSIGAALERLTGGGGFAREEIVVCTKGGYIPLDEYPPATPEGYQGYLRREFYARSVMAPSDVVSGGHCLAPGFLRDCLSRSRANLGVDAVDVYYVHNPEQQLAALSYDELLDRLRAAFACLEECVDRAEIGVYGCATWQGFRAEPGARGHLALADLVQRARDVAGERQVPGDA